MAPGVLPKFGPLKSGYDHFYGFRGGALDYYSHTSGGTTEDLWDDDVPVHQAGYLTDLLGRRAVDAVNGYAKSRQPFIISLHFSAPHWPWKLPAMKPSPSACAGRIAEAFSTSMAERKRPISG